MTLGSESTSNIFSSIAGLPVHPLVVHLAVVVLPAAALALIVLVAVPRWRRTYGWLGVGAAFIGAAGALLAKESGEALAATAGLPATHALWGDRLFVVALLFAGVAIVWFAVDLRTRRHARTGAANAEATKTRAQPTASRSGSTLGRLTGGALVALSLAVLALTVVVGHSGATAVWGGQKAAASGSKAETLGAALASAPDRHRSQPKPGTTASGTQKKPNATAASGRSAGYTLVEVGSHNTSSSCWVAIGGKVYDLTTWISRHPGGPEVIRGLCGTDASSAFANQHGGERDPARELATFAIGPLR